MIPMGNIELILVLSKNFASCLVANPLEIFKICQNIPEPIKMEFKLTLIII